MDLDAKTPPKAIVWSFGLLADSNAGRCDCGITRASRARARLFPPSEFRSARRQIGLPKQEDRCETALPGTLGVSQPFILLHPTVHRGFAGRSARSRQSRCRQPSGGWCSCRCQDAALFRSSIAADRYKVRIHQPERLALLRFVALDRVLVVEEELHRVLPIDGWHKLGQKVMQRL